MVIWSLREVTLGLKDVPLRLRAYAILGSGRTNGDSELEAQKRDLGKRGIGKGLKKVTYGKREVAWGPKEVMEWPSGASEQLIRTPWILLISCETTYMP